MRKLLSCFLILALGFAVFSGCDFGEQGETPCMHSYNSDVRREASYDYTGLRVYTCMHCGDTYTETIDKLVKPVVPNATLEATMKAAKYSTGPFTISVGELMNKAMDGYGVKYYTGEEAIDNGFISRSSIASNVDIDFLYCAVVSGYTRVNPDLSYLTEYQSEAIKVWMIFDENNQLLNSGVAVCSRIHTYAVLLMSRGY